MYLRMCYYSIEEKKLIDIGVVVKWKVKFEHNSKYKFYERSTNRNNPKSLGVQALLYCFKKERTTKNLMTHHLYQRFYLFFKEI